VIYRGGFPRSKENVHMRCQQRAIYYVQKELEEIGALEGTGRAIICDRGSLDGLAYWPGIEEDCFKAVGCSMEKEIERYDWVIHLETASGDSYQSSLVRLEKNDEALLVNEKPNRLIIPNATQFLQKADTTLKAVKLILDNRTIESICADLSLHRS
jgi:hypothetical protein